VVDFVNMVMNFWFCMMWAIYRLAEDLSLSKEGLCFRELVQYNRD
jgi:hypothetical protein